MRYLWKLVVGGLMVMAGVTGHGQAMAQERIKVGFIAPLTGTFGPYGRSLHNSMLAYIQNHGDTVAGKKIEIIVRDNTTNTPENAKRLAQELVSREGVHFLTGLALTPDSLAIAPVATQSKTPAIVMLSSASGLTLKSPYLARVSYTNSQSAIPMAHWAYKNGIRKAYIMVSDYAPGIESEEAFKKAFVARGGQIIGSVRVPLATSDYSPFVQRLKDAAPEAVFVFLPSGEPMTSFAKSYAERGVHQTGIKLLTEMDLAQEYIRPMGDAALPIINTMSYYDTLDNEENKRYKETYFKISGESPGSISVGGYDGMAVIYEVARKLNGKIDGEKAMAAMKGMKINSPRGEFTIDPDTRDIVQNIYIAKVEKRGGRYVPVVIDTFANMKDTR